MGPSLGLPKVSSEVSRLRLKDCQHQIDVFPRYMGGCRNSGPLLGPPNTRSRIRLRTQKRDQNFDDHPYDTTAIFGMGSHSIGNSICNCGGPCGKRITSVPCSQPRPR